MTSIRRVRACLLLLLMVMLGVCARPALAEDGLQAMKARGVLRWGADAEGGAPYAFPDANDPTKLVGFEVDLAEALAAKLGVKAEMVQNSWDGLVPALQRGNFDIAMNGLEITPERRQQIAFSRPYYVYAQQIAVRKDSTGINELKDLKGKAVGTLSATVAHRLLEKLGGVDIRIYPGTAEPYRDLANGRVEAVLLDLPIANYFIKQNPDIVAVGQPFEPGYYGIGVRKEDKPLKSAIDGALTELMASGDLEDLYTKWGLWDRFQEKLRDYKEEAATTTKTTSTLREWRKYLPLLLKGAVVTIEISTLSMILAVGLGLMLALMRLFGPAPVRFLAAAFVEVVRGTPLLIQLYLIYYGLPNLGIRLDSFVAGILGLGMNYAAYEAENYRAGMQAIPHGQMEAALALGMTRPQAIRRVILPQAFRIILPPISNDFIALFKDSSLVSVITMVELTKVYGMLATTTYDYIGLGIMTAAIYFALSYPASLAANALERRLRIDRRAAAVH